MGSYITVSTPDGVFKVYLAHPKALSAPAVAVIQEVLGIHADLQGSRDELAARRCPALSPDLLWHLQSSVEMSDQTEAECESGFALYEAFDLGGGVADIAATLQAARSMTGAGRKLGLTGHCPGGLMTFIRTTCDGADNAVVCYGGAAVDHLDEALDVRSPLLIHLGADDEYVPQDALAPNLSSRVMSYLGCRRVFARHRGVNCDRDGARLANGRTADLFRAHLR